jgi:NAD(P)-dependent dehydrogenase (short-subunit alcohol dehydrogenase family)
LLFPQFTGNEKSVTSNRNSRPAVIPRRRGHLNARTPVLMWEIELAEISEAKNITIDEAWAQTLEGIPLLRPQLPEDIGNAIAFLASPLAKNITGQALNVDGGFEMS